MELTAKQIQATADARARALARATEQQPTGPSVAQENATSEARSRADYAADPSMLKDVVRGGASGLTEGVAGLIGLPRMAGDLSGQAGNYLMEKAGVSEPWRESIGNAVHTAVGVMPVFNALVKGPEGRDVTEAMSDLTGGYTEYTPQTFAGSAVKEIGNLAPTAVGMALTGGASAIPRALLYGAAIPGVLGTGAEKGATVLADKIGLDNPEMYGTAAKFGAEILSPGSTKFMLGAPGSKVTRQAEDAAKNLKTTADIDLTVGQMTHDLPTLQREASAFGFTNKIKDQQEKLKSFVYKNAGFDDIPSVREYQAAKSAAGADIEAIASTVPYYSIKGSEANTILGNRGLMSAIDHAGDPSVKDSLKYMAAHVNSSAPLTAAEINKMRSAAWELSVQPGVNMPAKAAAIQFGKFFDNVIENRLKDAGFSDAFDAYKAARGKYANFVLIDGAIQNSGVPSRMTFSPADLAIASHTVPGASGELKTVIDDAVSYMLQHSPEQAARVSNHADRLTNALSNYGMVSMASPAVAGLQAGLQGVSTLSRILHPFAMTNAGQSVMRNMAKNAGAPSAPLMAPAFTSAAGDYQQNYPMGRKRGGRVSSHEHAADQLVRAAERAKKGWSAETEPLLNQSDDAVAHALEVANRSI